MWYALSAVIVLVGLLVLGRWLIRRQLQIEDLPVETVPLDDAPNSPLTPPASALPQYIPRAEPVAVRPAPGAPNIDPPTDRHVSHRGTATIHKRTGRRTSTGAT